MEPQQPNPQQLPPNQPQNQAPDAGMGQVVSPTETPQQVPVQPGYVSSPTPPIQQPQPVYGADMPQPLPSKSSKMPLVISLVVVVLALAGIGLALALHHNKKNSGTTSNTGTTTNSNNSASFTPASVKACNAFTLAQAQAVLGSAAQASSLNGAADTSTADQSISSCGYQVLSGANVTTANVSLTGALTQKGLTTNSASFAALKSKDPEVAVAGIGDQAFYDTKANVLVVLKGSYSVSVTYMAESNGAMSYSQGQAEQIAKGVVAKL